MLADDAYGPGDVGCLRDKEKELNAMLATQAAAAGATYVDLYGQHRSQRLPAAGDPLGRALRPSYARSSGHPNPLGMRAMATVVGRRDGPLS